MKTILILVSLFFAHSTFAETIETSIAGIDHGKTQAEETIVMLTKDGQVGFLSPTQLEILEILEAGEDTGVMYAVTLDQNRHITGVRALPNQKSEEATASKASNDKSFSPMDVNETYTPTVLPNLGAAHVIFSELNPRSRNNSQCYNRAMVWSYEEFQRRQLYSKKVFLFFTTKYIREYHYAWWFHVSPFTYVNDNGSVNETILDYEFLSAPTSMKDWTDIFITPKTTCPSVDHYSDYSQHQEESYCYVIKTSMYFWQPKDIQALETGAAAKTSFIQADVDYAYRQGFR